MPSAHVAASTTSMFVGSTNSRTRSRKSGSSSMTRIASSLIAPSRGKIVNQLPLDRRGACREQAPAVDASDLAAQKQSYGISNPVASLILNQCKRRESPLHFLGRHRRSVEYHFQPKTCARSHETHDNPATGFGDCRRIRQKCPNGLRQEMLVGKETSAVGDVDVETR